MIVIDINELKKMTPTELKQARGQIHKLLLESDSVIERTTPGASEINDALHTELEAVQRELRVKEGRMAEEGEAASRKFHAQQGKAEYDTGALLRPDQSVRSYLQDHGHIERRPEFENLRFGALLRAMVSGPKTAEERAALAEGADNTGGVTVPEITLARFIDTLRAAQVCIQAGARTVPLTSDKTTIARIATDPVAAWRAEAGPVAESEPTFDGVVMVPRSLAVLVKASRELIEDSLNIESALEAAFRGALAVELDRVALLGSGTPPEPRGIWNTTNVNSHPGHEIADYDDIVYGMAMCWEDNSPVTSAVVVSPYSMALFSVLREAVGGQYMRRPPVLENIPFLMTTSIDEDKAIVGDFSKLLIGIRTSLRIEVLRELFAENLQYGYICHLRVDIGVEHPQSFAKISNLTTS